MLKNEPLKPCLRKKFPQGADPKRTFHGMCKVFGNLVRGSAMVSKGWPASWLTGMYYFEIVLKKPGSICKDNQHKIHN